MACPVSCVNHMYPKEKLTKIWDKKMAILKKIIAAKGGNKYDIHGDK